MALGISENEVKAYRNDGYLMVHRQVLPDAMFQRLKDLSVSKFAEHSEKAGGVAPSLIDCPHWSDPRLFEWVFADEMLALVEPLIGSDIAVFACHLLQKPPQIGKRVPWHEDSAYWNGRLEPIEVASVTLSLEHSTPDNGCLCVLPGTHRHGYSDYVPVADAEQQIFPIEVRPDQRDESRAVEIVLEPNQASIHDARIIHGSAPNQGTQSRSAFTVRYFPAHVKFVAAKNPNFQIYLARGKDRAGNPYSDPSRVYPPAGTIA
jgi:ectoine hydroxylase-related dioxygenase (phytanoyl-CoA dioxygenase family)